MGFKSGNTTVASSTLRVGLQLLEASTNANKRACESRLGVAERVHGIHIAKRWMPSSPEFKEGLKLLMDGYMSR